MKHIRHRQTLGFPVPEYIATRIRQHPPEGLPVVPGSTPVVAFGDLQKANVATLGWNPSRLEFLDRYRNELTGAERRLETLSSLGETAPFVSKDAAIRRVFEGCNGYFQQNPYKRWFNVLEKILKVLKVSYCDGTACHLDLVQWATDPTWRKLKRDHINNLIETDLSFLRQQLSQEHLRLLLLNGSGLAKEFSRRLNCDLTERIILGGKLFVGRIPQGIKVIGWNKNLQSSHGVSNEYIKTVGLAVKKEARSDFCD